MTSDMSATRLRLLRVLRRIAVMKAVEQLSTSLTAVGWALKGLAAVEVSAARSVDVFQKAYERFRGRNA